LKSQNNKVLAVFISPYTAVFVEIKYTETSG